MLWLTRISITILSVSVVHLGTLKSNIITFAKKLSTNELTIYGNEFKKSKHNRLILWCLCGYQSENNVQLLNIATTLHTAQHFQDGNDRELEPNQSNIKGRTINRARSFLYVFRGATDLKVSPTLSLHFPLLHDGRETTFGI